MRAAPTLVLLAVLAAGCTILPAPGPQDVAGRTDGYSPTNAFLKVFVRGDRGNLTMVDFDPRDWATSEIASRIDDKRVSYLAIHGQQRDIPGEVLVQDVKDPADLAQLSFQNMHATSEQRQYYQLQYAQLVERYAQQAANATAPPAPTVAAPDITLGR